MGFHPCPGTNSKRVNFRTVKYRSNNLIMWTIHSMITWSCSPWLRSNGCRKLPSSQQWSCNWKDVKKTNIKTRECQVFIQEPKTVRTDLPILEFNRKTKLSSGLCSNQHWFPISIRSLCNHTQPTLVVNLEDYERPESGSKIIYQLIRLDNLFQRHPITHPRDVDHWREDLRLIYSHTDTETLSSLTNCLPETRRPWNDASNLRALLGNVTFNKFQWNL